MNMSMKILHILNTSTYSGAENVAITIINNMSEEFESSYASLDGSIKDELHQRGIKFLPLKSMSIFEVRRLVKDYKPDVIHAHDYTTSIIAALSGVSVPIISHLHNNSPWLKTYHPYSFIYLLSTLRYKKILGVSSSIFKEYIFGKKISDKTIVVSNPININEIIFKAKNATERKKYDIVFVGRLAEPKNPLKFIDLIKKISLEYPSIKVAMIGDGNLKKKCRDRIEESGLTENIEMLGFLSNPYGIVSNSKALCMTSKWEGFGLVAIEALTLGVPVVASPVGGIPGIVDNHCGFLTADDGEYISELLKILNNDQYQKNKSEEALKKSKEFDNIRNYSSMMSDLYIL